MSNPEDILEFTDSDDDLLDDDTDHYLFHIQRNHRYKSYNYRNPSYDNTVEYNHNKYQRLKEINNVLGFMVNVHDATNFDIDLTLPSHLLERYKSVISNKYTYQDLDPEIFESGKDFVTNPKEGLAYRCRLRGIGIKQSDGNEWKGSQICVDIKQLIDRTDGWVSCTLCDIDVYQRLLVDIFVHTATGTINLHDYLLEKVSSDNKPIFFQYSNKKGKYNDF